MAVVHLRIDNRLIHGQVTVTWVQSVNANHLIVCNDKVAVDPIQKMMLPQAARGVKTSVLSVADTLAYAAKPEAQEEKIMVIAKFPADGLALVEGGLKPQEVNVGNQAPIGGTKFKMVTNSVAVTAEDAETYRKIGRRGFLMTHKMMPSDRPGDFLELLKQKGL